MTTSDINTKILVGIYINSDSNIESFFKTLYFLTANTKTDCEIILLFDAVNGAFYEKIKTTTQHTVISDYKRTGRAAMFNSLTEKEADYYCFMECGMLISPLSIDQMLEQLADNTDIGIIGPSTNNCWNQQSIFEDDKPDRVDLEKRIKDAVFENPVNNQEVNNLAESFFVITKHAVSKVGYADENYGKGYYWETDYCARIKKAGFKIVWSKGIYVHKAFIPVRKGREEISFRNLNYFKSKYCKEGNPITEIKDCSKCYGFYCKYFDVNENTISIKERNEGDKNMPLVSCIMPTKNRACFIPQSIKYFHSQNYPNIELIIVYDSASDLPENFIPEENIRLFKSDNITDSIGKKRNMACEMARGEIIIHWDDDDWYSTERISSQVLPILENKCDITGLNNTLFYLPKKNEFWKCSGALSKKMLVNNIHGGTLAYNKSFWSNDTRYPNTSLREDADFMLKIIQNGARLKEIDGSKLFVYLRHGSNSWLFEPGSFISPEGWEKVNTPEFMADSYPFYKSLFTDKSRNEIKQPDIYIPKVTCIMPTADRREFVPRSIKYFQKQNYKNKELVIIDDGDDKIDDLIPKSDPSIIYVQIDKKTNLGAKRNMACRMAKGEIILHWDDDDWMSKEWIQCQVNSLLKENADVTGLDNPFFQELNTLSFWQYEYPKTERPWVHGATLCYTKELWKRNSFKEINIGEDAEFLWSPCPKKIVPHCGNKHYMGMIHNKNVSPKRTNDKRWRAVSADLVAKNSKQDCSISEFLLSEKYS